MKIRAGFVSNSSSSSFIISAPKGFELTFENLAKFMFPDDPELSGSFGFYDNRKISASEAVTIVLNDLQHSGIANDEALAESLHRVDDDAPEYLAKFSETRPTVNYEASKAKGYWEKHDALMEKWRAAVVAAVKANNKDSDVYIIEYSDDCSTGSTMEHGGVFDNLIDSDKAIRISNH